MLFFLSTFVLTLKKFEDILRRKRIIRILLKTLNRIFVFKCLVGILIFIAAISLLMYPFFMSIFYKTVECNIEILDKQIEDCIETICELSFYFNFSIIISFFNFKYFELQLNLKSAKSRNMIFAIK